MAAIGRNRMTNAKGRSKVKTGCGTCRIRKIKCGEEKPFCQRCVKTGRTCDGYEALFKFYVRPIHKDADQNDNKSNTESLSAWTTSGNIDAPEIDLLERYFSTKTILDVDLDCREEARQVLQASLTDPLVERAISSLRALREDLEISGDGPESAAQQTLDHYYGLQQYTEALGGLASNLSYPTSNALKSALLCCQIFISIEQLRKNYGAMAQHMIRGFEIMHEYRARPGFVTPNQLLPARHDQLPLVDVFVIKLFAAPCKFADAPTTNVPSEGTSPSACLNPAHQQTAESCTFRTIAPDMRSGLTKIAEATLDFLRRVSQVKSIVIVERLLCDKTALLDRLESWLAGLDCAREQNESSSPEPVSVSFLRFFHAILKIILISALDAPVDLRSQLRAEHAQLQAIANDITDKVKTYTVCSGSGSNQGSTEHSTSNHDNLV